jgi:hypothetical protein
MKAETLFASLAMALFGVLFVVAAANAIAPPENKPAGGRPGAAAPAPAQPAGAAVPTHTPAEATAIANLPVDAKSRDAERLRNMQALRAALQQYKAKKGNYPSTGGSIQTACVYQKLDKLCEVSGQVSAEQFQDPRGNNFGYFYFSDGKAYAIYASLEGDNSGSDPCPGDLTYFRNLPNLYCLTSSRAE